MKLSPSLSGLLSDCEFEEEVVEMSPEEAALLQGEIADASEELEINNRDLTTVTKSLNRTFEVMNNMQEAIDSDATDKYTVSLLLSELSSIHKEVTGEALAYFKNLSDDPTEAKKDLIAGLQSSTSFIATLQDLIKKIWESIKKAAKWFWSKIKQFIAWIFGSKKKAINQEMENTAVRNILEAAKKTGEEFSGDLDGFENKSDIDKENIGAKVDKKFKDNLSKANSESSAKFGSDFKKKADNIFSDLGKTIKEAMDKMDTLFVGVNITMKREEVARIILDRYLDKLESNPKLLSTVSALINIKVAASAFYSYTDDLGDTESYMQNSDFTIEKVVGKSYDLNRFSTIFKNTEDWKVKINKTISEETVLGFNRESSNSIYRISELFRILYEPEIYDQFAGIGKDHNDEDNGLIGKNIAFLEAVYKSRTFTFRDILSYLDKTDIAPDDIEQLLRRVNDIGVDDSSNGIVGAILINIAAMPMSFSADPSGEVVCHWSNKIISSSVAFKGIDISEIRKKISDEKLSDKPLMSARLGIEIAMRDAKEKGEYKAIGTSSAENEIFKQLTALEKTYEVLSDYTSRYVGWFSEADMGLLNQNRDMFNNIFVLVQHMNALTPQKPLLALNKNQGLLKDVLESFNFREEIISAYKEVLK